MVPLINKMHRQIYNAHVLLGQFYLIHNADRMNRRINTQRNVYWKSNYGQ